MKMNILIAVLIGLFGYGLTVYFNDKDPMSGVVRAPVQVVEEPYRGENVVAGFSFTDMKGDVHHIDDFKGKVVVLNFWASWCPPCVKEFPYLLEAALANSDDVVLLAISSDFDVQAMQRFVDKLGTVHDIPSNVYIALDENTIITRDIFGTFKLPETLIIDRNQKVVHKLVGADWEMEDLQNRIQSLL